MRVIRDRAVGIDGDGDGSHTKKAERDQPKGKHGRRKHLGSEFHGANQVAEGHEKNHREADVVSGKVAGDEAGKNSERRAALLRRGDDFFYVT